MHLLCGLVAHGCCGCRSHNTHGAVLHPSLLLILVTLPPNCCCRYKQLLLKQRDIMIALTARLNERDEQIMTLQVRGAAPFQA